VPALLAVLVLALGIWLGLPVAVHGLWWTPLRWLAEKPKDTSSSAPTSLRLVKGAPDTFDVDEKTVKELKVPPPVRVPEQALPRLLELSGSLAFNPDRLAKVQARFPGEVVDLPEYDFYEESPTGTVTKRRPLRFGDPVKKGQVLAVVWSKDLGEKKSELVDSLVKLHLDEVNLARFEDAYREGAVPEAVVRQARSAVSADLNAVARARRTLHIWRVSDPEIKDIEAEADRIIKSKTRKDLDKLDRRQEDKNKWARVEVHAPFDGVIVEKNVTPNTILNDTTVDLYKVADMRKLAVFANAYEEDLRQLQDLQKRLFPRRIPWRVYLTADPSRAPLEGLGPGGQAEVDRIGYIVDPNQHTNLAIGLVKSAEGRLRVGQFVTATVNLPPPPGVVSVPSSALVEDGKESVVFVQPDPKRPRYTLKRVVVTQRFQDVAYVRSRISDEQRKAGLSELRPGEWLVTGGAVELKAALEEVQAKEAARERARKEQEKAKGKKGK
jgi:cobalt-zinc-cadmium efflux system membrane fusion protein